MITQFLKHLMVVVVVAATLLPGFVFAQSGSLQVVQPVGGTTPGGDGGGSSDSFAPQIFDVAVQSTYNSAIISWSTDEISLGKVAWGKNQDYGDGQITVEKYLKKHQSQVLNLQPQTQYYFRITAIDQAGNTRVYTGKFLTLVEPDTIGPQNVTNFAIRPVRDRMILSWNNPPDLDFANVRIVRSDKFYPLDPYNGEVVYEGAQTFISDGSVAPGVTYFYTIFAKDNTGNFSTGVVGIGRILWYSEYQPQYPDAPIVDVEFPQAPGSLDNPANFNDFTIIYNNGSATGNNNNLQLPEGTDIKITVPQSALPAGTDSLTVTVRDETNNSGESTYLFAFDKLAKQFFVTIPALVAKQSYRLVITVFNSAQQILQTIAGSLSVVGNAGEIIIKTTSHIPINRILITLLLGSATLLGLLTIYQLFYAGTKTVFFGVRRIPSGLAEPVEPKARRRKSALKPKPKSIS